MNVLQLDEFQEELEHLDFLDEMRRLVEEIAWKLATAKNMPVKHVWDDIDTYGNEPVFASLLFDKLLENR